MARNYNGTSGDHLDATTAVSGYGITSCIWFKLAPAGVGVQATLFSPVATAASAVQRLSLGLNAAGGATCIEFDTTSTSAVTSPEAVTDSTSWHVVIGTHESASARRVWLDGVGKTSSLTAKTTSFGGVSRINGNPTGTNPFAGKLCYATIWSIILSDKEISWLASTPPWAVRPEKIIEFWPDERGASPVPSLGSTPHNMVVTGTTNDNDFPLFASPALVLNSPGTMVGRGPQYKFQMVRANDIAPNTNVDLTGNSSLFTHAMGASTGAAAASGVALVSSHLEAALLGGGELSGRSATSLNLTGNLGGAAALSGSSALYSNLTAPLGGSGALSGASQQQSCLTGAITGAAALSGAAATNSELRGSLLGSGALAGSSVMASSLIGNLALNAILTGVMKFSAYSSGAATGAAAIAGTAQTQTELRGSLLGSIPLSGSSYLAAYMIGSLAVNMAVSGTASSSTSLRGALTGAATLQGSSVASLEARGAMIGTGALQGYLSTSSSLVGSLGLSMLFSGIACYTTNMSGSMSGLASLSGLNPALQSFISGQLTASALLAGSSAAFTHARGNLGTGVITSFQRVWVGDAQISGTSQSVAVFSN